ncbi:MAG: hypothetical protein SP1CHLAM54_02280 [Chlamydiia bacterium]|nr:hypothetical protein [Chlamydiia bacterium]MCH9615145.1 hypothetical protein [Chlamydiia bacterium]MCH9628533.1 hypothetical protein [Chlamydiia bacterium]
MLAAISTGLERAWEKLSSRGGKGTALVLAGVAAGAYIVQRNKESWMAGILGKRDFIHYRTTDGQAAGRNLYLMTFLFANSMGSYQHLLPKLPLPDLSQTLNGWYTSVAPLLSADQQEETKALMSTFRTGVGCTAQAGLREYDRTVTNYTTEAWIEKYLQTSAPLHTKDSWVGIGTNPKTTEPLKELALRIAGEREFRRLVQTDTLPPFYMGDTKRPVIVCMDQMKRLHGVSRLPGEREDSMRVTPDSHHVILMIKEQLFRIDFEADDGTPFTHQQIYTQICAANYAAQTSNQPPVGRLTALPRRDVYPLYEVLKTANAASVKTVETAMSVYSFDADVEPADNHAAADMLFMNQHNRWFHAGADRAFGKNGLGGGVHEHTYTEATAAAQQHTWIEGFVKQHNRVRLEDSDGSTVAALPFTVTSAVSSAIEAVPERHDAFKVHCERMPINRSSLKKLHWSPDAVLQMAILLTYYRLTGRLTSVYESGMTRLFAEGRTETINTSSAAAKTFVESPSLDALRAACDIHKDTTTQALDGKGAFRHLSVLKWHMERAGLDISFFESEAWKISQKMEISSSTTPTRDAMGGFPPPSDTGIGCSYIIQAKHVDFTLTGNDLDPGRFYKKLQATVQELLAFRS